MLRYSNTSCVFPRLQWPHIPEKWSLLLARSLLMRAGYLQLSPLGCPKYAQTQYAPLWIHQLPVLLPNPRTGIAVYTISHLEIWESFFTAIPPSQCPVSYQVLQIPKDIFYSTIHFFPYQLFLISDPCHSLLHGHLKNFCKAPFPLTSLHSAIRGIQIFCQNEVHTLYQDMQSLQLPFQPEVLSFFTF